MAFWKPAPEPPTKLGRYRVLSSKAGVRVSPVFKQGSSTKSESVNCPRAVLCLLKHQQPATRRGDTRPSIAFAILSGVLLSGGLLPQYWEIYKLR